MNKKVALIGENSIGYVKKIIEIWNNQECAVLIDVRLPNTTLLKIISDCNIQKCYIDRDYIDKFQELYGLNFEIYLFEKINKEATFLPTNIYKLFKKNYSKKDAIVIFSSGTTGRSKGVRLSHYAINKNADYIIDYMRPQKKDCIYIVKSLTHSSTLIGELLVGIKAKIPILISNVVIPPRCILENIIRYNVTILCMNPKLLEMFIDYYQQHNFSLNYLKTIYVSGSILRDSIYEKSKKIFRNINIYNVYGLTEAGPRVTAQTKKNSKSNSVGKSIKHVKIKLIDIDTKRIVNKGIGVIHVKTPCIFNGYLLGKAKFPSMYKKWLNTGDLGYFDKYKELHIVNRIDDLMIIDSHKIYPFDIEEEIMKLSDINDCCIIKEQKDDKQFLSCLYVSAYEKECEIREILKKTCLAYEIPKKFKRCGEIPRTLNGKINKTEVRKLLNK